MSDAPFIISPAGFIADVNWNTNPQAGLGPNLAQQPYNVSQLLPGASVQIVGTGQTNLAGQAGLAGSMQVDMTVGVAAAASAVAFLVGSVTSPTRYLGVAVDSQNRPKIIITDSNGTSVVSTTPTGAAFPTGATIQVRLYWDSTGASGSFAKLFVNGVQAASGTFTGGSSAWTAFAPAALIVGQGIVSASLPDFGGKVQKVQLSPVAR